MIRHNRIDTILEKLEKIIDRVYPEIPPIPDFNKFIAFRWDQSKTEGSGQLVPVAHPHMYDLKDLVGIDHIVDEVVRNTRQFVNSLPANNVLLWGERGCGKSSLVKGLRVD